jgi:hypothetical protein
MKVFVDKNVIIPYAGMSNNGLYPLDLIRYAQAVKITVDEFLLPANEYYDLIMNSNTLLVTHHRRLDSELPFFYIAGIKIQMITNEEADKYRLLL